MLVGSSRGLSEILGKMRWLWSLAADGWAALNRQFPRLYQDGATAIIVLATGLTYFSAPLVKYAAPIDLMNKGYALVLGLAFVVFCRRAKAELTLIYGLGLAAYGAYALSDIRDEAFAAARANDQRCAIIQNDMLRAIPRKKDGPALFQAFGCRPQGTDIHVMVPATRAEYLKAHSRPLRQP